MSIVKPFWLTKKSRCPKCGGPNLKHISSAGLGANFDCDDCGQRFGYSDYIKEYINKVDKNPFMSIFEKVYYEVNKPR